MEDLEDGVMNAIPNVCLITRIHDKLEKEELCVLERVRERE